MTEVDQSKSVRSRPRLAVSASIKRSVAGGMPQLVNLSEASLVLRTRELLQPGQTVDLTIHFTDSACEVQIEAEVVWANQQLGDMALRFVTIREDGSQVIAAYRAERAKSR